MANKYKNTQTLNPALRSIGNMNVRGVVKGGTSDADKAERYGLPVMVSETGYIDPSLIEGGGGVSELRVKELIKDNLQPYNDGQEIKDDIDGKASKSELPDIIKNQLQQNPEIKNEITNIVGDKLAPYTNGQEIKNEVNEKVNTSDYEADFVVFDGEQGATKGEKIKAYIDGHGSDPTAILQADMSPYGQGDKAQTGAEIAAAIASAGKTDEQIKQLVVEKLQPYNSGQEIKDDVNLKVNITDYDADFNNFDSEQGATKGAKIQSYINKELTDGLANKVDISAMSPYNGNPQQIGTAIENAINATIKTDEQIKDLAKQQITTETQAGGVIDTAIDAKIGDNLLEKTDLAPYGQNDKTQIGAEIAAAIQSAGGGGHTDEQIKELAEEKIVADVAGGGTIDTAISNKLTTEKVLRQGDLAPYGATNISETGKDIQDAINAVKANVVVPTDMGEFYTDDKTKIGENIKNAILAGGDPDNPSVKQSDLAPYGVADVKQAGADIQNGINTAITNAFAPYTNGQSISDEQELQNVEFNKKINDVNDSIVPTIRDTFGYGGFEVKKADIIKSTPRNSSYYDSQAFIYVKGNNSYTYVDPKDGKLKRLKCDTDTIEEVAQLTKNSNYGYKFIKCYSEPDFIICLFFGDYSPQGVHAFSRDGGQTWSVFTYQDYGWTYNSAPFFFKDKNGNYYFIYWHAGDGPFFYKLQVDDLSASLYAEMARGPSNALLRNDNIILPNRDGNFYKSTRYGGFNIYNGCYMWNITPQNWNDVGTEQSKQCYLRIVFADGRKENFDGGVGSWQGNWMYSMIKIGNKLLAFGAKKVGDYNYLAMAVCDDIHENWDDPQTPLEFHEVTAKNNKLNGKTLAAGFLNLSDYGSTYAKNGLSSYLYYDYKGGYASPANDLPIIHIEADRFVYMIGMQNQNADYSGNPIPIGMKLDLEKHEVTDVPLKVDLPAGDGSMFTVFPCCYQYNIGCYKKEGPFYQVIKRGNLNGETYYLYYAKISQKSTIADSFQVGDILVSCREMGESWIECNGSTFDATNYPLLAEIIKDLTLPTGTPSFLTGGTTTFKVYIKAK